MVRSVGHHATHWLLAMMLALPMMLPAGAVACINADGLSIDPDAHRVGHCGDDHAACDSDSGQPDTPPIAPPCDGCSDSGLGVDLTTPHEHQLQLPDLAPMALLPSLFTPGQLFEDQAATWPSTSDPPPASTPLAHLQTIVLRV